MNAVHGGQTWQTWVTLAIGLLALAYLVRRWWPRTGEAHPSESGAHCGTSTPSVPTASGGCQSCSGGCGSGAAMPPRDHRATVHAAPSTEAVHWHPPRQVKH